MYYVYDCNDEQIYTATRAELYRFVERNISSIGNFPEQKKVLVRYFHVYGSEFEEKLGLRPIRYIVYDENYNLIDHEVLISWIEHGICNKQLARNNYGDHTFRNGPVPGTGGWGNGHYFRRPQTRNELKANCDPDHKEYVRKGRYVPSSWDDIPVSADRIKRSWKKNKKRKQWM